MKTEPLTCSRESIISTQNKIIAIAYAALLSASEGYWDKVPEAIRLIEEWKQHRNPEETV